MIPFCKMHNFNVQAKQTVENLCDLLEQDYVRKPAIFSSYSIGAEIEVKFKYYFPEIFRKYFEGRKYYEYTDEMKKIITDKIELAEKHVLPLLEETVTAGIPKGTDKYWEFSFTPVYNLTLLHYQIEILKKANLIPSGEHSLHLTIGKLKNCGEIYYVLLVLELLFVNKERIKSGFSQDRTYAGTWAKKGLGGIHIKNEYDLVDAMDGIELRTLFINDTTDIYSMFELLSLMLNDIHQGVKNVIIEEAKGLILRYGLTNKNWNKPHKEPEIWDTYIACFDDMSNYMKQVYTTHIS